MTTRRRQLVLQCLGCVLSDGHSGQVGRDGMRGVAVKVGAAHVVAQGGAGVAVPRSSLFERLASGAEATKRKATRGRFG